MELLKNAEIFLMRLQLMVARQLDGCEATTVFLMSNTRCAATQTDSTFVFFSNRTSSRLLGTVQLSLDRSYQQKPEYLKIASQIRKIPNLPVTVCKVLEICSRTDASPNELNKVISLDPVLTGQVLKLINSAYYSLQNKVTSLTRAIILLGLNTVKNLALSSVVHSVVQRLDSSSALTAKHFWEHSVAVGACSKLLAIQAGVPRTSAEEYFIAGLLHDVGKVVFGSFMPKLITDAAQRQCPVLHVELETLGFTHAMIGLEIAERWMLSPSLLECIAFHHAPREASEEMQLLTATVSLADWYMALFDVGFSGTTIPAEAQFKALQELSRVSHQDFLTILPFLDAELSRARLFLGV